MLARILGICLLYNDPAKEIRKFSASYSVLGEIAKRVALGEHINIRSFEKRKKTEDFRLKMMQFEDLNRLGELYFDVFSSSKNKEHADFEIQHITMEELAELENR